MRSGTDAANCFPTGRHYPGLADRIADVASFVEGLIAELDPGHEWRHMSLAVIDFETTGRDPVTDRVLEIGIVLIDRGEITGAHGILVNPGVPIPDESRAVHQISDADVVNAPRFGEVIPRVLELLAGRIPVAYNATFDRAFLHAEIDRNRRHLPRGPETALPPALRSEVSWVDPLVWAREVLGEQIKSRRLNDVCEHLGIVLDRAHRADVDAEATGRVLLALSQNMPRSYRELIRIQARYAAHQDVEFAGYRRG